MVRRVFGDDVPFPHEADIALCGALLDVQYLLQLLAKVYVGDACLPPEDVTCDIHQFPFLALLLFLTWFLALVHVHPGFLVPSKEHQRHVQRASVPYFQGFYHRLGRFFVFLNGQDSSRLALQLAAQMSPQFQSVGDEVQHAQNTRVVDTRQPIKFIYHRHAFRFIVGTLNKVCDAVNDDQLDAAVLVVELVHALYNGVQAFLA